MKQSYLNTSLTYCLAALGKRLLPKRWRITCHNLKTVFPDQDTETLAWQCYLHFFSMMLSIPKLDHIIANSQFIITNQDVWKQCLREERVVVLSAHVGFWEILPKLMAKQINRPIHFFYRHSRFFNDWLLRSRQGENLFAWDNQRQVKEALKGLKRDGLMGIMADQGSGYLGSFFGRPMRFPMGPEKIIQRMQVPVYFLAAMRQDDHFLIHIERLDEAEPMLTYIQALERLIIRYPQQYYWLTRLWKT